MNGQQGDQPGQGSQESHLSYLLNAANGQAGALMGYGGLGGQRLGYGDASLEEQILQRASALRAEALMQQQQQQQAHQRQHHLGAALAALQQQQQLSSLAGLNPSHLAALSAQEQEAVLGRAAALRELGISAGSGSALAGVGMERLQQLELGRLEELERRRQQLAALAGYSGAVAGVPRPNEITSVSEQLGHDSIKSDGGRAAEKAPHMVDKTKEELRKTPGTVIVPCRARGMPMDHNFKTAYFVISEDAKHGEDLVCSYFACRNGGVKFRYCAHCMAPVAKRNFCRRHDHGISAKGELKDDDDDDASMEDSDSNAREMVEKSKGDSMMASSLDVLSKAASSKAKFDAEASSKRSKPVEEDDGDDDDDEAELAHISAKRRKMWSALLVKRPRTKDPRHLSSWLNEVLTVSDFETPFDQTEAPEVKASNGSTPTKKRKIDKDSEGGSSPKKEKKSASEKKKRKSEGGDKAEAKPKKEKAETKKKPKSPAKEKPAKKEAAKPKEAANPKKEVAKPAKKEAAPKKDEAVKPKAKDAKKEKKEKESPKKEKEIPKTEADTPKELKDVPKEKVVPMKGKDVVVKEKETPKVEAKDAEEEGEVKEEPKAEVAHGKAPEKSTSKEEEAKPSEKTPETKSPSKKPKDGKKEDEDGFAGSFADWRDRKKEKSKKGPPSLLKK